MKNLLNAVVESKPQQKRPTSDGKAIAIQIPGTIVLQTQSKSQQYRTYELSNCGGQRQKRLRIAIRRRQWTETLEILSQYGFDGDLGIFVLRYLQRGEEAA